MVLPLDLDAVVLTTVVQEGCLHRWHAAFLAAHQSRGGRDIGLDDDGKAASTLVIAAPLPHLGLLAQQRCAGT
jgi:hypothetical protein